MNPDQNRLWLRGQSDLGHLGPFVCNIGFQSISSTPSPTTQKIYILVLVCMIQYPALYFTGLKFQ